MYRRTPSPPMVISKLLNYNYFSSSPLLADRCESPALVHCGCGWRRQSRYLVTQDVDVLKVRLHVYLLLHGQGAECLKDRLHVSVWSLKSTPRSTSPASASKYRASSTFRTRRKNWRCWYWLAMFPCCVLLVRGEACHRDLPADRGARKAS